MTSAPRFQKWELALAGLTLLMFAEAFLPRLLSPNQTAQVEEESRLLRYLWLPFYGLIFVGLLAAGRDALAALLRVPVLLLLPLLAVMSALWSMDPDLSFRRGVALLATTLLGVYLAARFDWVALLRLLGVVWLALIAASFIAGIVAPKFAIMQEIHPGAWAGGWWEKNQLGGHAARASFLFAFLAWRDADWRKPWIGAAALAVLLVLLSTSATALLGTLVGFAVLVSAWWMVQGRRHALLLVWAGLSVGGVVLMLLLTAPGLLLALIGRDATFTGRTDIWSELFRAISERPLLGYGYLSFWAPDSEPRYWLGRAVDWDAPSGHNGWLDLAISLGIVGVIVFAIDLTITSVRAAKLSLTSPTGVYAAGFLIQFLLFAMSESIIAQQNSILWAMYAMISAKLALSVREASRDYPAATPALSR